jgi:hypothetical protein
MAEDIKGMRQHYQETGKLSSGGGPECAIDKGASGSHRDNNWKKGAAQSTLRNAGKVGPYSNVKDQFGSKY